MIQNHLSYEAMTNYGCFYTPEKFVDNLIAKIKTHIPNYNDFYFMDNSCGYGSFFLNNKIENSKIICADMDAKALNVAKQKIGNKAQYFELNALKDINRAQYGLTDKNKLVIIGNPPYNDITSIIKSNIKMNNPCDIDGDIKTRDLGISFLLSYNKLKADYVAILHPLSYMLKKPNYDLLKPFYDNYEILDCTVTNSQEFSLTSKGAGFPICIILYKRNCKGTNYTEIINRNWKTIEGKSFSLNLNSIRNYISKYPNKNKIWDKQSPLFWTMRDINALRRNKTFINDYCDNAIIVEKNKLPYYCYVDIFKDYTNYIPYYFGNCDVFIDEGEFDRIKDYFIAESLHKHPQLRRHFIENYQRQPIVIESYFKKLLGEHYEYKQNY